jgi:collagenase-like PrtC family protease
MNMLTQSSRKGDRLNGFCLDYCFLNCSSKKIREPINYIRSTWIRPEDLHYYEEIGYDNFKLVERSSPADLLLKRVKAYANRSFSGNLLEIAGPVAQIKKEQGAGFFRRLKMARYFLKPGTIKWKNMVRMKQYAESVILHDYSRDRASVYIENKSLDGFLEKIIRKDCPEADCRECGFCREVAERTVVIKEEFKKNTLEMADQLAGDWYDGTL